ncbi:MAG TPA: hypothetical protein VFI42_14055, partial [Thermomicrobiaceae bacterium]|nr:hypothetical protein [Thermomicrobiaceae bacterium]
MRFSTRRLAGAGTLVLALLLALLPLGASAATSTSTALSVLGTPTIGQSVSLQAVVSASPLPSEGTVAFKDGG